MAERTKALTPAELATARAATRRLIAERFEGNASAAARKLGISVVTLTEFANEKRGAGARLLLTVADELGVSLDQLVGRSTAAPSALCRHPAWSRVVAAAREQHPEIDTSYFEDAGLWMSPTAGTSADVALALALLFAFA